MSIEAMKQALEALELSHPRFGIGTAIYARATASLRQAIAEAETQMPVAYGMWDTQLGRGGRMMMVRLDKWQDGCTVPLYPSPPQRQPLTEREVELIDGMIEVQVHHAMQCDRIANRTMADKQKGWDMERVELLQKLKAAHGITGEQS